MCVKGILYLTLPCSIAATVHDLNLFIIAMIRWRFFIEKLFFTTVWIRAKARLFWKSNDELSQLLLMSLMCCCLEFFTIGSSVNTAKSSNFNWNTNLNHFISRKVTTSIVELLITLRNISPTGFLFSSLESEIFVCPLSNCSINPFKCVVLLQIRGFLKCRTLE